MNTLQRIASKAKRQGPLPKFWRKNITPDQEQTLQTAHTFNIAAFTDGTATRADLWDWLESTFTYTQFINYLEADGLPLTDEAKSAIAAQLHMHDAVIERFVRTGRVGFSGPELEIARTAAMVMDDLVQLDRNGHLTRAALWSDQQIQKMKAQVWV